MIFQSLSAHLSGDWISYLGNPLRWLVFVLGPTLCVYFIAILRKVHVSNEFPDGMKARMYGVFLLIAASVYTEIDRYGKSVNGRLFVIVAGIVLVLWGNWQGVKDVLRRDNTTETDEMAKRFDSVTRGDD